MHKGWYWSLWLDRHFRSILQSIHYSWVWTKFGVFVMGGLVGVFVSMHFMIRWSSVSRVLKSYNLCAETISVITNDGRNIVVRIILNKQLVHYYTTIIIIRLLLFLMQGILKGFDQATNIILDESHERVFSTKVCVLPCQVMDYIYFSVLAWLLCTFQWFPV